MSGFNCATCGQFHDQLPMCFGSNAPALWFSIPEEDRANRCDLSSDQCIIDEQYFFVLGRVVLPVVDGPEPFVWLAWVSLSEENFQRMSDLWESSERESEPPYFGWFQSALAYDPPTLSLRTSVHTMPLGERPLIKFDEIDHPLVHEQIHGITMQRVQEIAEAALHG